MTWILARVTATEVVWSRDDGVEVGFAKQGLGEPWSDEKSPPPDIDVYAPPRESVTQPAMRPITKFAFRMRFTPQERAAVEFAAVDNPAATTQQRQLAAGLRAQLRDFELAEQIQLDHPELMGAVRGLETYGLLARGRANEVLLTPPREDEVAGA